MANVTYTSRVAATQANREQVYEAISLAMMHFVHLGIDLVSVSRNAGNFILVTVTGPIAADQLAHLGLV